MKKQIKHKPSKIFFASLSMIIVFFAFLEIFLRLITFYVNPEKKILLSFDPIATDPCPRKAVYRTVVDKDLFWTNPATIREDLKSKPANMIRIICLGDSTTAGYHLLPKGYSFPEQLSRILKAKYADNIEVINEGAGGYSSYQGLVFLKKHILQYSPSIITLKFGCNDSALALPLPDKDVKIKTKGVLMDRALNWSRIYQLVWFLKTIQRNQYYFKHSNELPLRVSKEEFEANINEMIKIAAQHNIKVIFITSPTRDSASLIQEYNKILRKIARSKNVPLVDAGLKFEELGEKAKGLFYDAGHLKADGEKIIAVELAGVVSNLLKNKQSR